MNILMINLPFSGHTNPTLPLAKLLVDRGHSVTYVNAEEFREKIARTGAEFVPYKNFPKAPDDDLKKKHSFRACYETALSLDKKFDILIYEMFFYPGIKAAEKLGIPCVRQFSQSAWSEESARKMPLMFRASARLIDLQVMEKELRRLSGIGKKSLVDSIIHDKPDLNVVYVSEKFHRMRETFDDSYMFIAPRPEESPKKVTIPYEQMKKPIVYISLGTVISDKGFCRECIKGFGGKDMSVILSTGRVDPSSLENIPGNIYAYSFVPQTEVLRHADVFVTHCGMNSVAEAMYAGVPMVATPFLNDQPENAAQVQRLGLGKKVLSFPISGRRLYNAVTEVLSDRKIHENAIEMKKHMDSQSDMIPVAERIEMLAERK